MSVQESVFIHNRKNNIIYLHSAAFSHNNVTFPYETAVSIRII